MVKVYTRGGDKGETSLVGGKRVSKSDLRLEAYGTIDELNSFIGLLLCDLEKAAELSDARKLLGSVQRELFNIGSRLACEDEKMLAKMPEVAEERITELEDVMDLYTKDLTPLKHFVLPGGSRTAAMAHVARTITRRAERHVVALSTDHKVDSVIIRYLNRLSDYFFVLARNLNRLSGITEPIWDPKKES